MPKQKTSKTILKRFKFTSTGKILRGKQALRHRKFHKSKHQLSTTKEKIQLSNQQKKQVYRLIN